MLSSTACPDKDESVQVTWTSWTDGNCNDYFACPNEPPGIHGTHVSVDFFPNSNGLPPSFIPILETSALVTASNQASIYLSFFNSPQQKLIDLSARGTLRLPNNEQLTMQLTSRGDSCAPWTFSGVLSAVGYY
jgi:hypothetical protein